MVAFALDPDLHNSYVGIPALERLGEPEAIVLELVERVRTLPDSEYEKQGDKIEKVVAKLQSFRVVNMLFKQWRASPPLSSGRLRFEGLLATVEKSLLNEELHRIRSDASDPAMSADAEQALVEGASWKRVGVAYSMMGRILNIRNQARRQIADRVAEIATRMKDASDEELAESLRSGDDARIVVAAKLAGERRVPVGDIILELLLQKDSGWNWDELVSALVLLWGEQTAVLKVVEATQVKCRRLGTLSLHLAAQLKSGDLSSSIKTEVIRLGVWPENLSLAGLRTDGDTFTWLL